MQFNTFPAKTELGFAVAKHVLDGILNTANDRFILGVLTGSTPMPFFEAFISLTKEASQSGRDQIARKLHLLVMDDFIDPATGMNIPASNEWSAIGFIRQNFLNALNTALNPLSLSDDRLLVPRAGYVGSLKKKIVESGGIDMQIIATDPYEGHVGQNFPGQPYCKTENEKCGPLSDAFLKHHDWAGKYYGVTFGLDDFIDMVSASPNGQLLLMLWGEAKHSILQQFLAKERYDPQLPLSFLWLAGEKTSIFSDYTPGASEPA